MELAEVAGVVGGLVVDWAGLDLAGATVALGHAAALCGAADRVRLAAQARVQELSEVDPSIFPEELNAAITHRSRREAERDVRRVAVLAAAGPIRAVFDQGLVSLDHVDVLHAASVALEPAQRAVLLDDAGLAVVAVGSSPEEFGRAVRQKVRVILADDGRSRLEQQRRQVQLRSWVDRGSGMICFRGQLDPETGIRFLNRAAIVTSELFHDALPDTCPSDPEAKQAHLAGLALVALTEAKHGHPGVTEVITVIGVDSTGRLDPSSVRHQRDGIELPFTTVERQLCTGEVTEVVARDGVVLDVGRTRRLATHAQRRALRVMHPTCAIPDCPVLYDRCEPHHLIWWRHGGTTDLSNLLPLCARHHHRVHDDGWTLHLQPGTRELTITLPDGNVLQRGPPRTRAG